jgi:hypothetical protein
MLSSVLRSKNGVRGKSTSCRYSSRCDTQATANWRENSELEHTETIAALWAA